MAQLTMVARSIDITQNVPVHPVGIATILNNKRHCLDWIKEGHQKWK